MLRFESAEAPRIVPAAQRGLPNPRPPRLGIPMQIVLLVAVPLAFLIAVLALTTTAQQATERAGFASRAATAVLEASDTIFKGINDTGAALTIYSHTRSTSSLAPYYAEIARLPGDVAALRALGARSGIDPSSITGFVSITDRIQALWKQYLDLVRTHQDRRAQQLAGSAYTRKLAGDWQAAKFALDSALRNRIIAEYRSLRQILLRLTVLLVGVTAVGIAFTVFVATRFGLRLVQRLQSLADNAQRLSSGERAIPIEGDDEIASLDKTVREAFAAYEREHATATTLQRALLPHTFPELPGLRIDTAYIPATEGLEVGGDWYDVFKLSEDRIGFSVGDVSGHGLHAAIVMTFVRQAIRNAAGFQQSPAEVLRYVNGALCDEDESVVTAVFGTLDMTNGMLHYSLAGHSPPLLVSPSEEIVALEGSGLVLGFDRRTQFKDYRRQLSTGSGLVLFTDGVVETERNYLKGMEELLAAVRAEMRQPSANIAQGIQRRAMQNRPRRDDAAVLFLGITQIGAVGAGRHSWSFDARDWSSARRVKRAVLWQLAGLDSTSPDIASVEAILGELLSNVVRHSPGEATVILERRDADVVLHVEDRGAPFSQNGTLPENPLAETGRGLAIVRAFARDFGVSRTANGNRVSATLPLPPVK